MTEEQLASASQRLRNIAILTGILGIVGLIAVSVLFYPYRDGNRLSQTQTWQVNEASVTFGAPNANVNLSLRDILPGPSLPRILSNRDRRLYMQAFAQQEDSQWDQARRTMAQIENDLLIGHLQAHRMLHNNYYSEFDELAAWNRSYIDHPQARTLYRLAAQRRPEGDNTRLQRVQDERFLWGYGDDNGLGSRIEHQFSSMVSFSRRPRAKQVWDTVHDYVREGMITVAYEHLSRKSSRKLMQPLEYDIALWSIATGYYIYGKDIEALKVAKESAKRSGDAIPGVYWIAGISAWRQNKIKTAAGYFEKMAMTEGQSEWDLSTAAFWAYRALYHLGEKKKAYRLLNQAAGYPRTFYGILALRTLGKQIALQNPAPEITQKEIDEMMDIPAVRRAVALAEIDRHGDAELELRNIFYQLAPEIGDKLLKIAHLLDMPAVKIPMARFIKDTQGKVYDYALYPTIANEVEEQFVLDPALVYAFIRQESGFNFMAKSYAGAAGLMQIMPGTANFITRKTGQEPDNIDIQSPGQNLIMGQNYLAYLMKKEFIDKNLIYLAAAYNAGPSRLREWLKEVKYHSDPLLFIESIPARETRSYVEQVLAHYWIYQQMLGDAIPSLDEVATGAWPHYAKRVDSPAKVQVAAQ